MSSTPYDFGTLKPIVFHLYPLLKVLVCRFNRCMCITFRILRAPGLGHLRRSLCDGMYLEQPNVVFGHFYEAVHFAA